VIGGIRGVFFFNFGGGFFSEQPSAAATNLCTGPNTGYRFFANDDMLCKPTIGGQLDANGNLIPVYGPTVGVTGFRLQDAKASYGIGLETFALGFPIHFDWSWRTMFNKQWEDVVFAAAGGTSEFRKPRFSVWIGYDF
jgi:hypothetical protein